MGEEKLKNRLAEGVVELGLKVSLVDQQRLLTFLQLLVKWNRTYNLTAVRDPEEMVVLHLLDSLSIDKYLEGGDVLDVGSGAGLPGIPLAIIHPEIQFTLLDSNGKKTRFIKQAAMELGLSNVVALNVRVESCEPKKPFSTVMSRAFAELGDMVEKTRHLCVSGGRILAMKGVSPEQEVVGFSQHYEIEGVFPVSVPGLDAARHVVCLRRK